MFAMMVFVGKVSALLLTRKVHVLNVRQAVKHARKTILNVMLILVKTDLVLLMMVVVSHALKTAFFAPIGIIDAMTMKETAFVMTDSVLMKIKLAFHVSRIVKSARMTLLHAKFAMMITDTL